MEHREKVKMYEIEDQAFKNYLKIKEVNFKFNLCLIGFFLLVCMQGYINYKQSKKLDSHKEVILLMHEGNKIINEHIQLIGKNQILINNKIKQNELNRK
ncbi:MAG: hypothetical protein [Caudoviricetes sp.]|nr:MAG: hypothetical protein [Caudoviricetes sp.]